MAPEMMVDLFRHAIYITCMVVTILVLPGLLVGLLVAMFQAATQINEMSLSFVPRLLVTFLAMLITGPWLLKTMVEYTRELILDIPSIIG